MTTLTLGGFEFARYEIPENIPFGTSQKLNVHELVGGKRIIDVLGQTPTNPTWSGWFVGENALDRARYLKGLCEAGKAIDLTWSELSYSVVIRSFEATFRLPYRIPYSITCEVVTDNTAPVTSAPSPSPQQLVSDDMDAAGDMGAQIGNDPLTGLLGGLSDAITAVGDFTAASASAIAALQTPLSACRTQVGSLLAAADTTLASLPGIGGVVAGLDPAAMIAGLPGQVVAAQQAPILVNLDRTLGRMSANLSAVTSGSASIVSGGGNLFQIASQQFNDPMAWTALAQANGITDPTLSGITSLIIPNRPTTPSGGVLNA